MDKIEEIVLNSSLSQNGLNKVVFEAIYIATGIDKEVFDTNELLVDNGIESIDIVEILLIIEDELDIELDFHEVNVYEDNFHMLVELVKGKINSVKS